jgi:hypothetical protein
MQSVAVGDCEYSHYIRLFTRGRSGRRCVFRIAQLGVFAHKCAVRFGRDFLATGSPSGCYGRDNQSFDQWCRRQNDPLTHLWVIDEIEGELGTENRTAEVHEHDDAGGAVNLLDRLFDADGVGAERHLVQARGDRDGDRAAVQHLACECHGGSGQGMAVRHNDDTDEAIGRFVFRCCH